MPSSRPSAAGGGSPAVPAASPTPAPAAASPTHNEVVANALAVLRGTEELHPEPRRERGGNSALAANHRLRYSPYKDKAKPDELCMLVEQAKLRAEASRDGPTQEEAKCAKKGFEAFSATLKETVKTPLAEIRQLLLYNVGNYPQAWTDQQKQDLSMAHLHALDRATYGAIYAGLEGYVQKLLRRVVHRLFERFLPCDNAPTAGSRFAFVAALDSLKNHHHGDGKKTGTCYMVCQALADQASNKCLDGATMRIVKDAQSRAAKKDSSWLGMKRDVLFGFLLNDAKEAVKAAEMDSGFAAAVRERDAVRKDRGPESAAAAAAEQARQEVVAKAQADPRVVHAVDALWTVWSAGAKPARDKMLAKVTANATVGKIGANLFALMGRTAKGDAWNKWQSDLRSQLEGLPVRLPSAYDHTSKRYLVVRRRVALTGDLPHLMLDLLYGFRNCMAHGSVDATFELALQSVNEHVDEAVKEELAHFGDRETAAEAGCDLLPFLQDCLEAVRDQGRSVELADMNLEVTLFETALAAAKRLTYVFACMDPITMELGKPVFTPTPTVSPP